MTGTNFEAFQILITDDTSAIADVEQGKVHEERTTRTTVPLESDRLSTIPDEAEEPYLQQDSVDTYLHHTDLTVRYDLS